MIKSQEVLLAEEVLGRFSEYLVEKQTRLSCKNADGRINSAINEDEIIDDLRGYCLSNEWFSEEKGLKLEKPRARSWYDFSIVGKNDTNTFIPVNIKVSKCNTSDNLNSKLGLYYSLTGKIPSFSNGVSWESYFKKLYEDLNYNKNKDYFFFIIDKEDRRNVFFTSLKQIRELTPNGNNLPFQSRWSSNTERVARTHEDAVKFLLLALGKSIEQRGRIVDSFSKFFPEFYKGGN